MAEPGTGPDVLTIVISATVGAAVGFFGNLIMQGRTRWLETQTYGATVAREILLVTRKLDTYQGDLEGFEKELVGYVPKIPLNNDDTLIYRSNTSKIGLLDKSYALTTMKFYQRVRDLRAVAEKNWSNREVAWDFRGVVKDKGLEREVNQVSEDWIDELHAYMAEVKDVSNYGKGLMNQLEAVTSMSYSQRVGCLVVGGTRRHITSAIQRVKRPTPQREGAPKDSDS